MTNVHEEISKILSDAHSKISKIDAGDFNGVKESAMMMLQQRSNQLTQNFNDIAPLDFVPKPAEPLTKMFGREFNPPQQPTLKNVSIGKTHEEVDNELQNIINLYSDFPTIEPKDLLDKYSETEIRGVAKMAGLPHSDKIDTKYISSIKKAMGEKQRLNEVTETATAGVDDEVKHAVHDDGTVAEETIREDGVLDLVDAPAKKVKK